METPKDELEGRIVDAIKEVFDPEIPVNVYDLGLIYEINIHPDQSVFVKMTLTAPGCPVAGHASARGRRIHSRCKKGSKMPASN